MNGNFAEFWRSRVMEIDPKDGDRAPRIRDSRIADCAALGVNRPTFELGYPATVPGTGRDQLRRNSGKVARWN
jgi:hypothetical protein